MTAARKERPPAVYVETAVQVDPHDLEAAGWVYVGDQPTDMRTAVEDVIDTIHRWHDDTHEGPFQWCRERPCDDLRGAS